MIIFPIFKISYNFFLDEGRRSLWLVLSVGMVTSPSTLVLMIVSKISVFTFKAHVKLGTVLHEGWQ
jgi:hypothetical protein